MEIQLVVVLLIVFACYQKSEVDALEKLHLQNVHLLCLNTSYASVVAVVTESIIKKLYRKHNTTINFPSKSYLVIITR